MYQITCHHCGHSTTLYSHRLGKTLVVALKKLVDFYEVEKTPIDRKKDFHLTNSQYGNFQKLQYFGLMQQTPSGWVPTELGIKFIYGEKSVRNRSFSMGGKTVEYHESIDDYGQMVTIHEVEETALKKRKDYAKEKSFNLFNFLNFFK